MKNKIDERISNAKDGVFTASQIASVSSAFLCAMA